MSYILEALKRSERERGRGAVSPLTADLRIADPDAGRRHRWWPWAGAALAVGVLLGAAGWWFVPWGSGRGVPPARAAGSPARTVPHASPAQTAPRAAEAMAAIEKARTPAPPRPETAVPRRPARAAVHRVAAHPSPAPPPATTPAPRPRPPAVPVRAAPPPAAPPVPRLDDLPASFRARLPKLDIEVYVYSPRRALRWVLINLHKYREGEQLPGGEVLEEITSGGLVLRYAGRRFLVPRPG